jgi:hypothetical protein
MGGCHDGPEGRGNKDGTKALGGTPVAEGDETPLCSLTIYNNYGFACSLRAEAAVVVIQRGRAASRGPR